MSDSSTSTVAWITWPQIERALAYEHVEFKLVKNISLGQIDFDKSRRNMARLEGPINKDQVAAMVVLGKSVGLTFPPLSGYWEGEKIVLVDGNQRAASLVDLGYTGPLWVYVIDCPPKTRDVVTRLFNVYVGRGYTKQDKLEHALHVARSLTLPDGSIPAEQRKQTALKFGLTDKELATRIVLEDYKIRFADVKDPLYAEKAGHFDDAQLTQILYLNADQLILAAVQGLGELQHIPDPDKIRTVVRFTKAAGADFTARYTELIKQIAQLALQEDPDKGKAGARTPAWTRLRKGMRGLSTTLDRSLPEGTSVTAVLRDQDQIDEFKALAASITERLSKIVCVIAPTECSGPAATE